ncbi:MAG: MFS transporter, partial [Bryobacteraceae bacterium]|nr:MFS transporter [Bryobacteraceae bacterium]
MSAPLDREFLKLWIGQTISEIGSRISREGLPLTAVLVLGASATQMGILAATGSASVLVFGLAAGVIVDRVRRRPVMIITDLLRAALLGTIPLAAYFGVLSLAHLLIVAALVGICTVLFDVSYQAYLPSLVGAESLFDDNRRLAMSASTAEILGPSMTGVLIQTITAPVAILVDAFSFLASAISIIAIRRPEPPPVPSQGLPTRAEIFEGARIIRSNPILLALAARAVTAFLFFGVYASLYLLFAVRELKLSTSALGITIALGGVGSFVGAYVSRYVSERFPVGQTFFTSALAIGLIGFCIPAAAHFPAYGMALLAAAQLFGDCAWTIYHVSESTYRQRVTDPGALGRVNAAMQLASRGMVPV